MAIELLKRHKSQGTDQFPSKVFKAGSKTIRFEIHIIFLFGIRKNCLRTGRGRSFYIFIRTVIKQIVVTSVN